MRKCAIQHRTVLWCEGKSYPSSDECRSDKVVASSSEMSCSVLNGNAEIWALTYRYIWAPIDCKVVSRSVPSTVTQFGLTWSTHSLYAPTSAICLSVPYRYSGTVSGVVIDSSAVYTMCDSLYERSLRAMSHSFMVIHGGGTSSLDVMRAVSLVNSMWTTSSSLLSSTRVSTHTHSRCREPSAHPLDQCREATWLILPVVICLSQRLSHACLSSSENKVKPRMAHYISYGSLDRTYYLDNRGNSRANTC